MGLLNVLPLVILVLVPHTSYSQNAPHYPASCTETVLRLSGIHTIQPQPGFGEPFSVYCDHDYDGGGWTVIQTRTDGSVFFFRGWQEYENGFGDLNREHWLGLKKIFEMTSSQHYELVVVLEDQAGTVAHARYDHFVVANPESQYRLILLGNYSGNAGDSLTYHLNQQFSTFDADNDSASINCALRHMGGWWYNNCVDRGSNLNGLIWMVETGDPGTGVMIWHTFRGVEVLRSTRMLIRAVNYT